ncbi:probably inactive leucine-rich repeat receptor-like protein kinase At5g48380 [Prosopis cineraria]|uniref:probably inactive leucine-rich repeat receptor-like protein kinase At5g48380 n=1 Tax=Prosopis cineraria TaxID=364024 RepID=UPI0024107A13|nr:probably inactive leucine-rich repeat receptor-like protein kinase At5g48380 [Prosopis cineraria]
MLKIWIFKSFISESLLITNTILNSRILQMNPVSVSSFSVIEVAPKTRSFCFLLCFFLLLACLFTTGHGSESDIHCLRSIKQSIDPFNQLFDWDFNRNTKGYFCGFTGVECTIIGEHRVSGLQLSNMWLKGSFPHGIENCSVLQTLDLSTNQISGEIPKGVAKLYSLMTLKLDGNQLSGEIPQEIGLLPQIKSFNVANNFLSGQVPVFTRSPQVSLSYANNSGLCGHTLEPCENKSSDRSFWYSFAIAYVCSATSAIVSFMYYYQPWRDLKKRRRNAISFQRKRQNNQPRTTEVAELLPLALQEHGTKELSALLERLISRISFGELCEATNYFSTDNVLGFGARGIVYKAKLPNNYFMAVKRLYDSQLYKREFLLETMISAGYRHQNIVPLLGFCLDKRERILVYEYMSNGKLQDWLQSDGPQPMVFEWSVRVYIALGLARGLSWLHKKCKIVHLNLSSECVLLSKDFEPKISNFGKAKFINHTNDRLRTKLLMINGLGQKGSVEKDVYSFGIILFELITGKRLSATTDSSDSVGSSSLMKLISSNLFSGPYDFYNVIDKSLIGKGFDEKIFGLIEVARDCIKPSLAQRPKMADAYKRMRALWEGYGPTYYSGSLKPSTIYPIEVTRENEIECID